LFAPKLHNQAIVFTVNKYGTSRMFYEDAPDEMTAEQFEQFVIKKYFRKVYVQYVPAGKTNPETGERSHFIICDENGLLNDLQYNSIASRYLGSMVHGGRLVGTVVYLQNAGFTD